MNYEKILTILSSISEPSNSKRVMLFGTVPGQDIQVTRLFTQCKDDPRFFTVKQSIVGDTAGVEDYKYGKTDKFPMKLWDHLIENCLDHGFVNAEDEFNTSIQTKSDMYGDKVKKIRDYIRREKSSVLDNYNDKYQESNSEDFEKVLNDENVKEGKDALKFMKDSIFNDPYTKKFNNTLKLIDTTLPVVEKLNLGRIAINPEERQKIGKTLLNRIDDIEEAYNAINKNKRTFLETIPSIFDKINKIYTYIKNIPFEFDNDSKEIENAINTFKTHSDSFYDGIEKIKKRYTKSIETLRFIINNTFLNENLKITPVKDINTDEIQSEFDQRIKEVKDFLDTDVKISTGKGIDELFKNNGIKISKPTPDLEKFVKKNLILPKSIASIKSYKCYRVINETTEQRYESKKAEDTNNISEHLFWHGSKNENMISIITNGLSMEYAGTGMFGKGIYFADQAKKSYGYTSGIGSIWAHGEENRLFLLVFKVNLGKNTYIAHRSFDKAPKGYDSVTALKENTSNEMNEYVVYDDARCTIYGMVDIAIGGK